MVTNPDQKFPVQVGGTDGAVASSANSANVGIVETPLNPGSSNPQETFSEHTPSFDK